MSTVVNVPAFKLRKCLQYLTPLFPKGSLEIPIGVNLSKRVLTITCTTSCYFQAEINVDTDETATCTVIYFSTIASFLPNEDNIEIEFTPTGMIWSGDSFDVTLPIGYSTVAPVDFSDVKYKEIATDYYQSEMNNLLGMNLDKLYSKVKPITIYGDVSVLKYPNTWVQIRSMGLPFQASIDPDHVRVLCKFEPKWISADLNDYITMKNDYATLRIPCRTKVEDNNFLSIMNNCTECVNVNLDGYLDKLRNASKLDPKADCKVSIYESGVKTTIAVRTASMALSAGNTEGKVLSVVHVPLQVWITFVKAMGGSNIQILLGGDLLCLRNQSMIIITRAVP